MNLTLRIQPKAKIEILQTAEYYKKLRTGLGLEFEECLDAAFSFVLRHPLANPIYWAEYRRLLVRRFPYEAFYVLVGEIVSVEAFFHQASDPQKIRKFLKR